MKKVLASLAVLCVVASVAWAVPNQNLPPLLVARFAADEDAFTYPTAPPGPGSRANGRWAKGVSNDADLFCDWGEVKMEALRALLASPVPHPYQRWEVRFATTGVTWDPSDRSVINWFGTIKLDADWVEMETNYTQASAPGGVPLPWTAGGVAYANFWQVPADLVNSVPFLGHKPSIGPPNVDTNQAVVDPVIVQALIGDSTVYGLRCWSTQWYNYQVYARGQWGTETAAPALLVYAVPEPASLVLIGLGGLGLLLRKRR